MLDNGLHILGRAEGLARPLDPDALAASHPLWASDVERFGPFRGEGDIFSASGAGDWAAPVVVCGDCASSLDVAWALREQDLLPPWGAVLAVTQHRGRGQLRRPWDSPAGNMHAAWSWPLPPDPLPGLAALLVGLALAETLESLGADTALKWPNDVLVDGRKVGGVLVEERAGGLMAGIGVNLAQAPPDSALRDGWAVPAASLKDRLDNDPGPAALCAALVFWGVSRYKGRLSIIRPKEYIPALERRLAWKGDRVLVHGSGEPLEARIAGLAPDGGLLLERDGRREPLYSGSISHISDDVPPPSRFKGRGSSA